MSDRAILGDHEVRLIERAAERAVQLYAEQHPRPTQVSQKQAAEMLGVSTRTLRNYIRCGKLRLNQCGLIAIETVDELRSPQKLRS